MAFVNDKAKEYVENIEMNREYLTKMKDD